VLDKYIHSTLVSLLNTTGMMNLMILRVWNPRLHLQEDDCIYRYGVVYFICQQNKQSYRLYCWHINCTIPYLYIQLSSWSWTLGLEKCRRHYKLKYLFRKGACCLFILHKCSYVDMLRKNINYEFCICATKICKQRIKIYFHSGALGCASVSNLIELWRR